LASVHSRQPAVSVPGAAEFPGGFRLDLEDREGAQQCQGKFPRERPISFSPWKPVPGPQGF
jgi:hypothetical protein